MFSLHPSPLAGEGSGVKGPRKNPVIQIAKRSVCVVTGPRRGRLFAYHRRDFAMRRTDSYLDGADELSDTTSASPFNQWAVGVGVAAAIAVYALYCFWTGTAILPGGRFQPVIHL